MQYKNNICTVIDHSIYIIYPFLYFALLLLSSLRFLHTANRNKQEIIKFLNHSIANYYL
jgi:hypothetical protein